MRVSVLTGGILAAALVLASPAGAQRGPGEEAGAEERFAPVGLVLNPTAYTLPAGRWLIGAGTFQQAVVTGDSDRQYSAGIFYGSSDNLYVGGFWTGVQRDRPDGSDIVESYFGGLAQYKLISETAGSLVPSFSIGGYAYTGPGEGGTLYAVASKNLMGRVRPGAVFLHAGVRWDTFDNDGLDDDAIRPFVGANLLVTRELALNWEWRQRHFGETNNLWAAGAIWLINNRYALSAGVQDPGSGSTQFYAGLSIVP